MTSSFDKEAFIDFIVAQGVLNFGDFTLKSGRQSPYFFNLGILSNGAQLSALGHFYAQAIVQKSLDFTSLFGPAYKGISIVCATSIALHAMGEASHAFTFNRKEAKTHGEKGTIIGKTPEGNVLLLDDVITAGTAIEESMALLETYPKARVNDALVAIDREEVNNEGKKSHHAIKKKYDISIHALIAFSDLVLYLEAKKDHQTLEAMLAYRARYGAL